MFWKHVANLQDEFLLRQIPQIWVKLIMKIEDWFDKYHLEVLVKTFKETLEKMRNWTLSVTNNPQVSPSCWLSYFTRKHTDVVVFLIFFIAFSHQFFLETPVKGCFLNFSNIRGIFRAVSNSYNGASRKNN